MFFTILLVPPLITLFEFGDEPINSGDMSSIFCTVHKGDFPIYIFWTLNGKPVDGYDGITVMHTSKRISQLSIDPITAEHAGEYECIAKNKAGVATHKTTLHVNGRK